MDQALFLDLLRGAHLLCVVLGMGPAVYFDLRSLRRIAQPLSQVDIAELHRIHTVVSLACVGLWLSGAALIWVRTGYDLEAFSPKLWCKIIVVTALTVNSVVLNIFAIPALARNVGERLIDVPARTLMAMMLCAGLSLACWLLALALGASSILKVAQWDVLLVVMSAVMAISICGVFAITFGARAILRRDGAGAQTN